MDSLAMSLINGHEVCKDDFTIDPETEGCFLTKDCLKKYISKLDEKMKVKTKYLTYLEYPVNFRGAISQQMTSLVKAIEAEDYTLYNPIKIR